MAQQQYATRWTSFAYEREADPLDCCTVNDLSTKIAAGGYTIRNLITDLTQTTRQFRTRAVEVPNEPPNLSEGCRRRRRRGTVPELPLREVGQRQAAAAQAAGHLLHPQRMPHRPLVPKVENGALTADRLTGRRWKRSRPTSRKLLIPRGFRSMNSYGLGQTIDPHDQAMGSKLTCATDQQRHEPLRDGGVARPRDRQADQPGRVKTPLVLSVGAASTQIKEIISFSGPGSPFPADGEPDDGLQSAHGSVRHRRRPAAGPRRPTFTSPAARAPSTSSGTISAATGLQHEQGRPDASQGLGRSAADDGDDARRRSPPTTPTSCSKTTAEAAPFMATAANVMAASPTGEITLGSVLGNTPTPRERNPPRRSRSAAT